MQNEFREASGLQGVMEAGEGGAGGDDAFLTGLMDDGHYTPEGEGSESPAGETPPEKPEEETPPEPDGEEQEGGEGLPRDQPQAGKSEGEPAPVRFVSAEIGGRTVGLPADAVQAISQAMGMDAAALLQKGVAYDEKASRELAVLNDYAQAAGTTREEYVGILEQRRDEQLVEREMEAIRGRYPEGTPDEALRDIAQSMLRHQREQAAQQAREREQAEQRMAQQAGLDARMQAQRQELGGFLQEHPEIRGSKDVPQEVWGLVQQKGMTVPAAYAVYERNQARAENERLRQELEAANKQNENRQKSTGSQMGGGDEGDPFLAGLFGRE